MRRGAECRAVRRQLWAEPGVAQPEPRVVEHLAQCAACRAVQARILAMGQGAEVLGQGESTVGVAERLWPALRAQLDEVDRGRQRAPRHWLRWGLVAAGVFATAVVAVVVPTRWPASPRPVLAEIIEVEGRIEHRTGAGTILVPAASPTRVGVNESIQSDAAGRFVMRVGADVLVGTGNTVVKIEKLATRRAELRLARGRLLVSVAPRHGQGHFDVSLPRGGVSVIGTRFELASEPAHDRIAVLDGVVEVSPTGGSMLRLRAGEVVVLGAGGAQRARLEQAEARRLHEELARRGRTVEVVTAPAGVASAGVASPEAVTPPPVRQVVPRAVRRVSPASDAVSLDDLAALVASARCEDAEAAASKLAREISRYDRARGLASIAECYVRATKIDAAVRTYGQVAQRFGDTMPGKNALYETGRLALQIGDKKQAERAFAAYVRGNPTGSLTAEARFRLCQLAMDAGDAAKALTCLRKYREAHPAGARASESYLLEATILRVNKNDCGAAMVAYDAYLAHPGEYAQQARTWRDWCARSLAE